MANTLLRGAPVDQQTPFVGSSADRGRRVEPFLAQQKALIQHLPVERRPIAAVRVDDPHLSCGRRVVRDESGESRVCIALVQQVAADDQIVLPSDNAKRRRALPPRRRFRDAPVTVPIFHRRQIVQTQVFPEETLRQRMAVAGRDVGTPTMADEAREGEPATDLQDPLAGADRPERQARRQVRTGRPKQTEQGPRSGRDAHAIGFAERIGKLLTIGERANDEIVNAGDGDALLLGPVARCRRVR